MTDRELITRAQEAMKYAYVPYSRFPVGAAIECSDGSVFTGCNVENASFGCAICAERTAAVKAVSSGHTDFYRIAVCAATKEYCTPCGICRQFLSEFNPHMEVLCVNNEGRYTSYRLDELLACCFSSSALN